MMIHDGPALDTKIETKGKGKTKGKIDLNPCRTPGANSLRLETHGLVEQEKTVHDGMKVFQAWGPHIKKFAMAFDVEEGKFMACSFLIFLTVLR